MKAYLLARPWLSLPLLIALAVGGFFAVSTLLTTHGTRRPGELTRRQQRRVEARRDSALARAAHLERLAQTSAAHATAAYDSAALYQDSATYYHNHEAPIRLAAADTAQYQRILSEIFGR